MRRLLERAIVAITCAIGMDSTPARADFYWVGGSGNWNDPANWSETPGGPGGFGVPGGDWVFLQFNDAVNRTIVATPSNSTFSFYRVESSSEGAGTLTLKITQGTFGGGADQLIGRYGHTAVVQTGGSNIAGGIEIGTDGAAHASYDIFSGTLNSYGLSVGPYGGDAIFRQHGGFVQPGALIVGPNAKYELSAGTLITSYASGSGYGLYVNGGGRFTQTGGSYTAEDVSVDGRYEWTGGTLNVTNSLRIGGEFVFPTSPTTLNIDGMLDLSSGSMSLTNASNVAVNLTDTSLVLRTAAVNPAAIFGSFNNPGFTHVVGNTLTIFPGRTLKLGGYFYDPIDCSGTISSLAGRYLALNGTLTLRNGGSIDASNGAVSLGAGTSQILGGRLVSNSIALQGSVFFAFPPKPPTLVIQNAGEVVTPILETSQGGNINYMLNGGSLNTDRTLFGKSNFFSPFASSAVFTQNGGTHTVSDSLLLGQGGGSSGTYIINGGTLRAGSVRISAPSSGFGFPPPTPTYGNGYFEVANGSALIEISQALAFGPTSGYAAVPGTTFHMTGGGVFNMNTDPLSLAGLKNTTFIFESASTDLAAFEAGGNDLGPVLAGFDSNFTVDTLKVGGEFFAAVVLVDQFDNQPGSELPDAVYVNTLILNLGSYLDLNGLNLYCRNFIHNGGTLLTTGGGQITVVPEPATLGIFAAFAGMTALPRRRRASRLNKTGR